MHHRRGFGVLLLGCALYAACAAASQPGPPGSQGPPGPKGDPGAPGQSVTAAPEPPGSNCSAGGERYSAGGGSTFICNGANGQSVTLSLEPFGSNCAGGGVKLISSGGTQYVCNGAVDYTKAIANNGVSTQAASFNISGSGAVGADLTLGGQLKATATWGENARSLGLITAAEGAVYDDGAGNLTLTGTVIVMNPSAGSWIRVAAGSYALGVWGQLYVDLPPGNVRGTTVPAQIGTWLDGDRPYDSPNRYVLAQRIAGGAIAVRFQVPAALTQPPSTLLTKTSGDLGDVRNNSVASTAGTWWDIPGRSLGFTKRFASSQLRVTYQDTLGTLGQNYDGCRWRILLDGNQISYFSDADVTTTTTTWKMSHAAHVAWATAAVGAHTVKVQNMGAPGAGAWGPGTTECLQGWNVNGNFLSVEEIP